MSTVLKNAFSFINNHVARRLYSKNVLRRQPIRVLNLPSDQSVAAISEVNISPKLQLTTEKAEDTFVGFPTKKDTGIIVPPYEKLQKNDVRFTKTLSIIKNRKLREKNGKILLEGKRLINDAIDAGVELQTLYFSREKDLADIKFKDQNDVEILKVFYTTLKVWSNLTTPPGVMGVFKRPTAEKVHILSDSAIPVTLVCDNIRDPGNLGSVIRNAAAAGCEHILLTTGCVDPWETKVLRAGCGGHFRIPIINNIEWSHLSNYIHANSTIFVADNSADIEGSSLTPEFMDFNDISEEDVEVKKYVSMNENNQPVMIDEAFNEPSELEQFEEIELPCYLHSSIKYPKENIILYIGGETHGVDPRITKLACEYGGMKVKIPLENNMDSLNSSFAMTIVLYEIKRQLSEKYVTK